MKRYLLISLRELFYKISNFVIILFLYYLAVLIINGTFVGFLSSIIEKISKF